MRKAISTLIRVPLGIVLLTVNTVVHVVPLFVVAIVKAAIPARPVRHACDTLLMAIAEGWIAVNSTMMSVLTRARIVVEGDHDLDPRGHYLVLANHRSWNDIPVLQKVFNRRIPLLRFFLKSQLFWVPLLGLAWWALDFPFMKRYSRETLARRPELAGRDIEATRRACERFRHRPVSVMNFVEGTRYTPGKHAAQQSPYRHLLKPRAGGVAFVLDAMGEALHAILDVTIVYADGRPTLIDLLANRVGRIDVHIRQRPIPVELAHGDYQNDAEFRERFQTWINSVWHDKDALMEAYAGSTAP